VGTLQRCRIGWCIRSGRFLSIGFAQFVFCLVSVTAQLSFARSWAQLPALIWGYVCALCFQTAVLSRTDRRRTGTGTRRSGISLRPLRVVARKYRRFPIYMVGYALASSVRDRLIQVVLGFGAGAAAVGRFGLAYRVAYAPNSLVYSSVSPVFFSIASRGSRESVGRFAAGLVEAVFIALVVPYMAFALEAPVLTDAFLSEKWHGTGPYLQALTGPALLLAATCWLDRAFDCFRRQRTAFVLEAVFTAVALAIVGCLSRLLQPTAVVWVFGCISVCYYWIYFLCTFTACRLPLAEFRRACINSAVSLALAAVSCALVHRIGYLAIEIPLYAIIAAAVIGNWMFFFGGLNVLRMLIRSRVDGRSS
jgi:O-antigen/teichoic acid export membrane protein